MPSQRLTFVNPQGDELAARLDTPEHQDPAAYVLFAHCFTCSKNLKAVGNISRALSERGFGVLRFDFTGLGESGGDFSDTNFSSNVADLICAADMLEERFAAPSILLGHSLGGAAVLQAADDIDAVGAVATIGAPHDPEHVTHLLDDSIEEIEQSGVANVTLAGRSFTIKKQFLDDLEAVSMSERIRSLNRALMVFHSPVDETVGVENARKIFEDAKHPKSFVSLDHADHLLTDESDSRYVGTMVAAWASKYLDIQPRPTTVVDQDASHAAASKSPAGAPGGDGFAEKPVDGTRTVTGQQLYRTAVQSGVHRLIADEPESMGGQNLGPTPYDLLLSALGTCTGMTLRMYADRKEWPLKKAIVTLSHSKIHAKDCENCESDNGKVDRIERKIEVTGDLSPEQRARLLEIADKCPVHRTLHGEIVVDSELVGDKPDGVASS
jgi:putative redox protein